ncbi:hypothetical protein [Commensalibacter nepenthis]|uniref:Uncharacterized protein n=1 Tax=Commensalibacter nepenthis TaxID=3043872 RepID=A0ABT6Q956_9PROT|nr:hypothetical protein [Commensalibacter sp. TBRC 10068]MDI2113439.1 hypothetical protein [Commensalibacter sp. TBRC 10068]
MAIIAKGKKFIQKLLSTLIGYKKKIISFFIPKSFLHPSKLMKRILITFFSIFGIGTIAFVIISRYFSLETLNSYFSLLSSLTTIFAALVAVLITQDFRKQKRAELLSEFSKEKSDTIIWVFEQLFSISTSIELYCYTLDKNTIEFYNFEKLSEKLQTVHDNQPLRDICINFTKRFEDIFKLVDIKAKSLIENTNTLLRAYDLLILNLNESIKYGYYFSPEGKEAFFNYIRENKELFDQINQNLQELLKLLKNQSLYL